VRACSAWSPRSSESGPSVEGSRLVRACSHRHLDPTQRPEWGYRRPQRPKNWALQCPGRPQPRPPWGRLRPRSGDVEDGDRSGHPRLHWAPGEIDRGCCGHSARANGARGDRSRGSRSGPRRPNTNRRRSIRRPSCTRPRGSAYSRPPPAARADPSSRTRCPSRGPKIRTSRAHCSTSGRPSRHGGRCRWRRGRRAHR